MAGETKQMAATKQGAAASPGSLLGALGGWSLSRKLSLAGVGLLCLVFFGVIIIQARSADYGLLFSNLNETDAASVVDWLKGEKIPYQLEDGGRAINIPEGQVYESRLQLAGAGIPRGGGVGFEIFDEQSFGMTDFAQKINYRRAMQGELARTIASLGPVESARVHLALPEKRVFREQQQKATASVILKLVSGRQLQAAQTQGIVNLVAGSVEGLDAGQVTVLDSMGRVLSRASLEGDAGPMGGSKLDYQQTVEKRLESRAQALLDRALGLGNSLVQVTASLDFSQRERMEEAYDPNASAVRSEQLSEEKGGREMVGGVPGVQSNFGDGSAQSGVIPSSRIDETTNYEISKVVSKKVGTVGELNNISVSVLVADRLEAAVDGGEPAAVPRSAEELESIEKMVRSALGINEERGDQISVVSRTFETDLISDAYVEATPTSFIQEYMPILKLVLIGLGAILLYLLLVRPMIKTMRGENERVEHYKTVGELESELSGPQPLVLGPGEIDASVLRLRQEIMESKTSPAQLIKTWLKE